MKEYQVDHQRIRLLQPVTAWGTGEVYRPGMIVTMSIYHDRYGIFSLEGYLGYARVRYTSRGTVWDYA